MCYKTKFVQFKTKKMQQTITEEGKFKYIESKGGTENLMLLHGLFGALSNFEGIINHFSSKYNVIVPILPILEMPILSLSIGGLTDYISEFVTFKGYEKVHVLGNSLGGHLSLLYTLQFPEKVKSLTLTGSSGLFESAMGSTYPKRGDYEYIKKKTQDTFYDPAFASQELIDEIYDITTDRSKALRIIMTSKSAVRHNLGEELHQITAPTLLIWGAQDAVTPPAVGEKFKELIQNSELHLVDKCGHAPMMERPAEFNQILEKFLNKI